MKRSSNSVKFTPEPQQPPQNQECPEHTLEICSLLLAIDSQFTNAMRHFCGEEKAMIVAKMLRMLLRRLEVSDDDEEGLPVPNERQQHINIKQLRLLMPKCDEHELNQTWEFLLTSQQIDEAVNDGRPDMETLECLPFDALSVLLTWKTIELVGDVVAQELRNQLVNCGVIGILLDALSHYSQQPNRHERQIGPVEFQELEAVRQTSSTQCAVPKKRQKVPATRGRGGGRKPRAGTRRNNYPQAAVSATSLTAFDNNDQEMANKKNERCIEALLKLLNDFLLDSHLTQMEEQWLSLLYMSCLRNFVRAYLMNGDLNEVVRLSPLYGQLFQLLSTLSKVVHVFVEDVAKFYANGKKAEDEEEEVANPQTSNSQRKKEQPQPKRKKQKEEEEKEKEHPAPTSALLNAFDVVLGEDPDDNSRRTSNAACSSSTASAMAQPILTQLRSFGGKIDDHIKLLSNTEEPDEEELMTLSSLSSLCEDIINIVAEQQTILHQALKPAEPAASQSESSSSSDEEEEPANKTDVKAAQNRGRKKSDGGGGGFVADEAFSERYCQALKEFQFAMIPFDDDQLQVPHYFRDRFGVGVSNATANQRIRRIGKELFALRSDLPLAVSSSVFICTSEDHIDALKVLITGPEGTPYENGCFEFDFYLPADFPNVPPKVQFLTTGNGSVRFNPNLYNEGKVCLSLLGTWPGDNKDQEWNAEHSTINQVINSIQGLILVPDPYFNEPGYEPLRGKPQGKKNSFNYNVNIQQQTLRWAIIEQMRNPPRCFEQVVHKHFWLKRDQIRGQLERWSLDNKGLMAMKPKLEEEFSRLEGRMTERPE